MLYLNHLKQTISAYLQSCPDGVSEYELIQYLRNSGDMPLEDVILEPGEAFDYQDAHMLFRVHFLVYHCLYQLRDDWLDQQLACLKIESLNIQMLPYAQHHSAELSVDDQLRRYYLDFSHFEETSAEQANELIDQFWQKFLAREDLVLALQILSVPEDCDFEEIKTQYRRLAMAEHPDRGGSAGRLAEINKAMDVVNRYYR